MNTEAREVLVVSKFPNFSTSGQQGLGGDTTPIDAGASHVARFNDRRPKSVLSGMFGSIEAPVAGSNNNDVEVKTSVDHTYRDGLRDIVARRRSNRRGTAAAATLRDSTLELCGRVTAWVQQARRRG